MRFGSVLNWTGWNHGGGLRHIDEMILIVE